MPTDPFFMSPDRPSSCDRGDVVLGWLTKVVATLAILGLMGFDAMSLAVARVQAEDSAQQAVRAASTSYSTTRDLQAAYDAAVARVGASGDTIDPAGFTVTPEGAVTLSLRREAPTLLVEKIPQLREYSVTTRTVTGGPPR